MSTRKYVDNFGYTSAFPKKFVFSFSPFRANIFLWN